MKIKWRGHASFLIEADGVRIITDPFPEKLGYPLSPVSADIVTVSHEHWDHNAADTVSGQPQVIRGIGSVKKKGSTIRGIAACHDHHQGRKRGLNTIFKISAPGIELVHLGDLGHVLSEQQLREIGNVDVLLLPVGGKFTINAVEAYQIVKDINPKIVIPMHFATPHLSFTLASVEEFMQQYDRFIKKPILEVQPGDLETDMKIIILEYLSG